MAYANHLSRLIRRSCSDDPAVVVHCAVAASAHASVLVKGICFVYCSLRAWCYRSAVLQLVHPDVSYTGVHDLIGNVSLHNLNMVWIDELLPVLRLVVRIGCVLWTICSTSRSLSAHMHLVLCRCRPLRYHWAVGHSGVDHCHLAVRLVLRVQMLLASWRAFLVLWVDEVLLYVLVLVLQALLNQRQVVQTLVRVIEFTLWLTWYLLIALQLVWFQHILPILHHDVLLILVCVRLIAWIGPLLWAYSRVDVAVCHLNLILGELRPSRLVLASGYIVHVNLVDIGLVVRSNVLLWSLHTCTVLLMKL